jgi:centromere protein S
MLLTRRNEELEEMMRRELEKIKAEEARLGVPASKPRGRPAGKATAKGKGKKL